MSDSFPITLTGTQWSDISRMLSIFAEPAAHALQVQVGDNLRRPRGDFDTRFRLMKSVEDEWFLVLDGFENEFRKKDLDGEHLHDYYPWVAALEDLTFTNPVERQQPI